MISDFSKTLEASINNINDLVSNILDDATKTFYNQLISEELNSYNDYFLFGQKTNQAFFVNEFAARALNDKNGISKHELFFELLAELDISFFSYDKKYIALKEKSRIGERNHVAIYHEQNGQKKMSWVSMVPSEDGYELDLLYSLDLYTSSQMSKLEKMTSAEDQRMYFEEQFKNKLAFLHDIEFHRSGKTARKKLYN